MARRKTILGVSWFNGRLHAVAYNRGVRSKLWECSEPVPDPEGLSEHLKEAVRETGYEGTLVSFVLVTQRLTHQRVEVPPIKGSTLTRFLERKVTQVKPFEGSAAWSYQRAVDSGQGKGILLHLLPRTFFKAVCDECQKAGLHPVQMVTPVDVLHRQLTRLPLESGEVGLLVAQTEESVALVAGRADGGILFGRRFNADLRSDPDRLAREVNRSTLYARQQFGSAIQRVWWLGTDEEVEMLDQLLEMSVLRAPVEATPEFWIEEALQIPPRKEANLIPLEMQMAPRTRLLVALTTGFLGLFLVLALIATGYVEYYLRREREQTAETTAERVELSEQRDALESELEELRETVDSVQAFVEAEPAPVGGWLFSHLGGVVPEAVYLTRFEAGRDDGLWQIVLEGRPEQGTQIPATTLKELERRLRESGFAWEELSVARRGVESETTGGGFRVEGRIKGPDG